MEHRLIIEISVRQDSIKLPPKLAINFLFDNCFFSCEIRMDCDPAPFLANLFLYYYENKWLLDTRKRDLQNSSFFRNLFCFIDGVRAINDEMEIQKNYKEIYPPRLELKKSIKTSEFSFFDLSIMLENKIFKTKLFELQYFPFL